MSVVSWMVETADGFLVDAAESQFGAVASNTGTIVLLMVTLSLIGVCINMAFQFRSMDGASFFWYPSFHGRRHPVRCADGGGNQGHFGKWR